MFETTQPRQQDRRVWAHAGEVAQWTSVLLAWHAAGWGASSTLGPGLLLLACVAVLHARERRTPPAKAACRGQLAQLEHTLPPSAMGLMMGTLWMGNGWCAGLGLSNEQQVLWHVLLMALLPSLVWVGALSATQGPVAIQMAMTCLGVLAAAQLFACMPLKEERPA